MDQQLYNAAKDGIRGIFDDIPNFEEWTRVGYTPDEDRYLKQTTEGDNIFHMAAREGQEGFVKGAVNKVSVSPKLISQRNEIGQNPIHVAAECGHVGIATSLVKVYKCFMVDEDGDVELPWKTRDQNGETPLHKAIRGGHEKMAIYLLKVDDDDGNLCLLDLAMEVEFEEFVKRILTLRGANDLHIAVYFPNAGEIVSTLLEQQPQLIRKTNTNLETPLHYAVKTNKAGVVKLILKAEVLLQNPTSSCFDALMVSSTNQRDFKGFTPLLRAAQMGHMKIVDIILGFCPKCISICSFSGETILHVIKLNDSDEGATLFEFSDIRRLVSEPDFDGNTPFHLAMKRQDHIMAKILLDNENVRHDVKNKCGLTPWDIYKTQELLSDEMVEIGYQLMTHETVLTRNSQEVHEGRNKRLKHRFRALSTIAAIVVVVTFATNRHMFKHT